jgi:hypothetical protein
MLSLLKLKWDVFAYNYSWPGYIYLFDGWLARSAMAVPFVGYLILFNDATFDFLTFNKLASESSMRFGLSPRTRLHFIYFGLILLGSANVFYYVRRPYALQIGKNQFEYIERALQHFTLSDYISIHGEIRHSGFDPYTGNYHLNIARTRTVFAGLDRPALGGAHA